MHSRRFLVTLIAFFVAFSAWAPTLPAAPQAEDESAEVQAEPYDEARAAAHAYAAQYKEFLSEGLTEVTVVEESIRLAEQQGFRALSEDSNLTPGAKFYVNNRDRALVLYEEWHSLGDDTSARLSTALFERHRTSPNGVTWAHVHETWLPDHAPAAGERYPEPAKG